MVELAKVIGTKEFVEQYREMYEYLYNHHRVLQYNQAIDYGDAFIRTEKELTGMFTKALGSIMISDREVAAFAFTIWNVKKGSHTMPLTVEDVYEFA